MLSIFNMEFVSTLLSYDLMLLDAVALGQLMLTIALDTDVCTCAAILCAAHRDYCIKWLAS